MEWSGCLSTMQGYLENSPLIVLGSGASMPYGLPSMASLAESIINAPEVKTDPAYSDFCSQIGMYGLEAAIDNVGLASSTLNAIRQIVWEVINCCDLRYFDEHPAVAPEALVQLLEKAIAPTPNRAVIVTTNYDRLPEYAADSIGATTITGFEGSLLRKLEPQGPSVKSRRIRARERIVDIWKVHGSLDWFVDSTDSIISFPLSRQIPTGCRPLIVPPGKNKYSSTHDEPYRTIITSADEAFMSAGSYLCIGYGFNDEHIQPKLLSQISEGKPIVILARTMTEACRRHIIEAQIKKYLIFERVDDAHTKVYGNGWEQEYEGAFWLLDNFIKIW